jgi:hypothetical protein
MAVQADLPDDGKRRVVGPTRPGIEVPARASTPQVGAAGGSG